MVGTLPGSFSYRQLGYIDALVEGPTPCRWVRPTVRIRLDTIGQPGSYGPGRPGASMSFPAIYEPSRPRADVLEDRVRDEVFPRILARFWRDCSFY